MPKVVLAEQVVKERKVVLEVLAELVRKAQQVVLVV